MSTPTNKKRKIFDGRYEVLAIVGRGSDSVVYQAKHVSSPNEVALKVLVASTRKDAPSPTDRLRKEALTLVTSRHRYVVRLDDFHAIKDICYLSMEYAPEGDLRKYTTKLGGKLPASAAPTFLKQCLEALEHIHASGIIHRDIKPDNILVVNENEIRLADFGLALLPGDEASLEELQTGVGTMNYLPSETLDGTRYDQRSDLYSLGVCFYEVLSGTNPFESAPLAMQVEVRKSENLKNISELVPGLPEQTAQTIMKLMAFDASERFQSASDAMNFLDPERNKASDFDFDSDLDSDIDEDFMLGSEDPLEQAPVNQDVPLPLEKAAPEFENESEEEDSFAPVPVARSASPYADRNPSPTTKIDHNRIQEIIAKEQRKTAEVEARRVKIARENANADQQESQQRQKNPKNSAQTQFIPPAKVLGVRALSLGGGLSAKAWELLMKVPAQLRPIVVALAAAGLVILLGTFLHILRGSPTKKDATQQVAQNEPAKEAATQEENKATNDGTFPALPAGMFIGTISGLLPGADLPLTMVSFPSQKTVTVVIGLEGWSPVSSPTTSQDGTILPSLAVRSNGVILNFTGQTSGDIIEGSFTNAVTGQVGSWAVKPFSNGR